MPKCCTTHMRERVHGTIIELFIMRFIKLDMHAKLLYVSQERVHGTIIELLMIFSRCQTVIMATAHFRPPKIEEEEISFLSETVPKTTK